MKTATFLFSKYINSQRNMGERRTYRLDPPLPSHDYGDISHVTVSAMAFDPKNGLRNETMVFPSTDSGKITFEPLVGGTFVGLYNHEQALRKMGYEIGGYHGP